MPSAWSYSRLMMMDGMQDLTILNKVSIRNISPWQDDEKNSPARVKMVLLDGPMTPSATFNPCSKVSGIYISYHIISYHIISYHIISYHIISYHIISYHIIITNVTAKQYVNMLSWSKSITGKTQDQPQYHVYYQRVQVVGKKQYVFLAFSEKNFSGVQNSPPRKRWGKTPLNS